MNNAIDRLLAELNTELQRFPDADAELRRLVEKAHRRLMKVRRGR